MQAVKIDHEYTKKILEAFVNAETIYIDINKIANSLDSEVDEKLLFHLEILNDKDLIVRANGELGVGIRRNLRIGMITSDAFLRLSANGHDYYDTIIKPEIWERIQSDFKEAALGTTINAGKELLKTYINNKLKNITT